MSRAIELSNEGPSKGHGGPYGAIIVKDGKIIGKRLAMAIPFFIRTPLVKT